ncbi:glycoside hydrolase family 43 protein [Bacteroides sp. 51]|uniref:glycoside hydrolase family 43 protein n=1 Tax=Bacteroides sp. 51 TaxID=2302938 RepID=UPI0013CFE8A3|nr:glycoside hydrolase family 43 protein [Bacteroides sp. 51]NDV81580.1 sugar-binding protein [Bacteroides sp. 51]
MKKITTALFGLLITVSAFADWPIFTQRYTADPYSLVHNGRLYLYCSHDFLKEGAESRPERGYFMKDITCISTDDMKNWTDHGEVFDVKDSKWGAKLSWAPCVIERNGKFYLYYGDGMNCMGVAVSDSPTGPFVDTNDGPIVDKKTPGVMEGSGGQWGMWCFDPGALIDDDGQAYLYFGGSHPDNARVIKLKENMIEVDGPAVKLNASGFFEASFVHKYRGRYYLSYSGHHFSKPSNIEYVTSDHPMTGFDNPGIAMTPPPVNDGHNHHHSIFEFQGRWYMAYHNRQVAHDNGVESQALREFTRNVCIDELFYNEDGSIRPVIATRDGVDQLKYVSPYNHPYRAHTMALSKGIQTAPNNDGGRYVTELNDGDWIMIKGVDFGLPGAARFMAEVAGVSKGASIDLRLDDPNGVRIGTCNLEPTEGGQNWVIQSTLTNNAVGVRDLFLVFRGQGNDLLNLNSWQFEPK